MICLLNIYLNIILLTKTVILYVDEILTKLN